MRINGLCFVTGGISNPKLLLDSSDIFEEGAAKAYDAKISLKLFPLEAFHHQLTN